MELILYRRFTANGAVLGELTGLSRRLFTLEDAWRNNERGISCIPPGRYEVKPHGWEPNSPFKFKRTWQLQRVPNRSAILIHAGNTHKNTEGCILVGMVMSASQLVSRVDDSAIAMKLMQTEIGEKGFTLTII